MTMSDFNFRSGESILKGDLNIPAQSKGLIIFAHGSGSSRHSPRNQFVARELNKKGFATLLVDLLTEEEDLDRSNVFDIEFLIDRLLHATQTVLNQLADRNLPIAYFGASTGAAAALGAAAKISHSVFAVVSRGGRPDLALQYLSTVAAPTLLIVGGRDEIVISLNEKAAKHLQKSKLVIVPGATHLFEEPGALDKVVEYAGDWFQRYVSQRPLSDVSTAPPP